MNDQQLLTRKEIAYILGLSYKQVVAQEKEWGISASRVQVGRMVYFRRLETLRILANIGLLELEV